MFLPRPEDDIPPDNIRFPEKPVSIDPYNPPTYLVGTPTSDDVTDIQAATGDTRVIRYMLTQNPPADGHRGRNSDFALAGTIQKVRVHILNGADDTTTLQLLIGGIAYATVTVAAGKHHGKTTLPDTPFTIHDKLAILFIDGDFTASASNPMYVYLDVTLETT